VPLSSEDRLIYHGDVAQLVEQRTENPCVGGSIPSVTTSNASFLLAFFVMFYAYILQSRLNDSFYKGSTDNVLRRFAEHNSGRVPSTSRYLPWDLVWYGEKKDRSEAVQLEIKLKNLSVKRTVEFIKKYPIDKLVGGPDVAPVRQSGC
jgi:putative endonuclease